MRRPLLVTVVKPVELGRDGPRRQKGHEDHGLERDAHVVQQQGSAKQKLDEQKRDRQSDEIGDEEHPPDQPAAPQVPGLDTCPCGILERGSVDPDRTAVSWARARCRRCVKRQAFASPGPHRERPSAE